MASSVFVASYFFKDPKRLRILQCAGATLWIAYGVLMHAPPVIVANVIVVGAIVASLVRK